MAQVTWATATYVTSDDMRTRQPFDAEYNALSVAIVNVNSREVEMSSTGAGVLQALSLEVSLQNLKQLTEATTNTMKSLGDATDAVLRNVGG